MNTTALNANLHALAAAVAKTRAAARTANAAFHAAEALSKRNKTRDVLIAATKPAADAANAAYGEAVDAFDAARTADCIALDVASLDHAVNEYSADAVKGLDERARGELVASLNYVASRYRRYTIDGLGEWRDIRDIRLAGQFEDVSVNIDTDSRTSTLRGFDVGFGAAYTRRDGSAVIERFSAVRVTHDGYNLTSTNFAYEQVPVGAFAAVWTIARALAVAIQYLSRPDAKAERKAVFDAYAAAVDSAEAALAATPAA